MTFIKRVREKIKTTALLVSLGANNRAKFQIFFLCFLFLVKKWFHLRSTMQTSVRLKQFDKTFEFFIFDYYDLLALVDVIGRNEYAFPEMPIPKIILDLGSNIGTSIIAFKLKYPNAIIYGFEPNPNIFERLQKNCAQFSNVHLFPYAISNQNGTEKLFLQSEGSFSSSLNQHVAHASFARVKTQTIDTIMQTLHLPHVDLIKFDIEGAELKTFRAFTQINRVDYFIGELHTDLIDGTVDEFCKIFANFNVKNTPVTNMHFLFKAMPKAD